MFGQDIPAYARRSTTASIVMALMAAFSASANALPDDYGVSIKLIGETVAKGSMCEIEIRFETAEDFREWPPWEHEEKDGEPADTPRAEQRPILQLDVPKCVKLAGQAPRKLVTPRDFQDSYLRLPYGRMIEDKITRVKFKLGSDPKPGDAIALNIISYTGGDSQSDARFVRQRYLLPLIAGSEARRVDASSSDWGKGRSLAIGDAAVNFWLPQADGVRVKLKELVGKSNLLILIYRAET